MQDFTHPIVNRGIRYTDPQLAEPIKGVIVSVDAATGTIYVHYDLGSTSGVKMPDERLTFLDGSQVTL